MYLDTRIGNLGRGEPSYKRGLNASLDYGERVQVHMHVLPTSTYLTRLHLLFVSVTSTYLT